MPKEMTPEEEAIARGDIIPGDSQPAADADDGDSAAADDAELQAEGAEAAGESADDADGDSAAEGADAGDEGSDGVSRDDDEGEPQIPKWRFDEAQRKARERVEAAEAKLAELEDQQKQKTSDEDITTLTTEIEKLQDQYEDKLLEGEVKEARAIRRDLNAKQSKLMDMRLAKQSQDTGQAAVEQMRFDTQLAHIEAQYPALNPDSDNFDRTLATEVAEVLEAFKARGYTPTASLQKAVHYVIRDDKSGDGDGDIVRSQRAHKSRKKVAKVAKKTPPDIQDRGRDSDKGGAGDGLPDPNKLTLDQAEKLTPEQWAELRGDFLEEGNA